MKQMLLLIALWTTAASADIILQPAPSKTPEPKKEASQPLDFVLVHEIGEASRDASSAEITLTVKGDKVHAAWRTSGRDRGMPGHDNKDADGVVKDTAAVRALLGAFDKMPTTSKLPKVLHETTFERFCVSRGKAERCIGHTGGRAVTAAVPVDEALLGRLLLLLLQDVNVEG